MNRLKSWGKGKRFIYSTKLVDFVFNLFLASGLASGRMIERFVFVQHSLGYLVNSPASITNCDPVIKRALSDAK
jgi:hypothetical protein